jgi:hypothetical protein
MNVELEWPQVETRLQHIIYAAKRGLWPILLIAPIFALIVKARNGGLDDFLYGMAPIALVSAGLFAFYLWRSQTKR